MSDVVPAGTRPFISSREDAFKYLATSSADSDDFEIVGAIAIHIMDLKIREELKREASKLSLQSSQKTTVGEINGKIDDYCLKYYDVDLLDKHKQQAVRYVAQFTESINSSLITTQITKTLRSYFPSQSVLYRIWTAAWQGLIGNMVTILVGFLIGVMVSLYLISHGDDTSSRILSWWNRCIAVYSQPSSSATSK